jgi:hypothetical protein
METEPSDTDMNCQQENESDPPHDKQQNGEPQKLVKFTMVNSYGSAEMDYKIKGDGSPIKLSSKICYFNFFCQKCLGLSPQAYTLVFFQLMRMLATIVHGILGAV